MYIMGLEMEKTQAKRILDSLIQRSVELQRFRGPDSPEFEKWKRDTRVAIFNVFGSSAEHTQDFERMLLILYAPRYEATGLEHHNAYVESLQNSAAILQSMIDEIDQYWPTSTHDTKDTSSASRVANDPTKVFLVHGRNTELLEQLCLYLTSMGLSPVEWNQAIAKTQKGTPNIAEILDAAFNEAQAVIVLLTGDDEAKLRHEFLKDDDPPYEQQPTPQSRPNVLFESGMAMGRYPSRTVLVQIGGHRPFSDIAGKHITHLDNTAEKRHELATKLSNAGCKVDTSGTRWLKAGDFQ